MSDITISRPAQTGLLLSLLGAIGIVLVKQLPEIQRYLKIRSM
ncbi:MAG TPA: hypothetical protein VK781_07850 [Solirubrobacteraceae bacterium]|jgi:hypothetical protein|nr:hypothetical protein [Solirubrobacteraceae bacterium]